MWGKNWGTRFLLGRILGQINSIKPIHCKGDLGLALTANPPRSPGRGSGGCDSAKEEGPRTSMAERGRLLSRSTRSGAPRSGSGECRPAERGTEPRDGVRRPPGGALPSRLRKGNGAPSRPVACGDAACDCALRTRATPADDRPCVATAPPLCGRRAAAPGLAAYVASGAIGAHARTLCSISTAEAMCTERGEAICCCCCGDTARCAVSRAALSALSAAASPTGEESRSDRSSAESKGGNNSGGGWLTPAARGE